MEPALDAHLERIGVALEALVAETRRLRVVLEHDRAAAPPAAAPPAAAPRPASSELSRLLEQAQADGDAEAVLDLRERRQRELDAAGRRELDERLGRWLSDHFQDALREGKAVEVIESLERAAEQLVQAAAMQPLIEALPFIRQSVHLMRTREEIHEDEFDPYADDEEPAALDDRDDASRNGTPDHD